MEHLHIDLAKDAYTTTNHKDKFSQMASWLEQKEKILWHVQHVKWCLAQNPALPEVVWQPPGLKLDHAFQMSKHPSVSSVSFDELSTRYGAPLFQTTLAQYIALVNEPDLMSIQLECCIWTIHIPFQKVTVWHKLKYIWTDPFTNLTSTVDSVHV
jgi:hypothetical protein